MRRAFDLLERLSGTERHKHVAGLDLLVRPGIEGAVIPPFEGYHDDPETLANLGACERLAGGWQFRGGAAGGANDHFSLPGLAVLSQMYLGGALSWLRPASVLPPIACSWEGLDDHVAAIVLEAGPKRL